MEKLYFLLAIAVCALLLVGVVMRLERKHRARSKSRANRAHQKAQLHHRYTSGSYHHIHGHASAGGTTHHAEMWGARHRRTEEAEERGPTFTATRLFADVEKPEDSSSSDLTMTTIEFTPEELFKHSAPRR